MLNSLKGNISRTMLKNKCKKEIENILQEGNNTVYVAEDVKTDPDRVVPIYNDQDCGKPQKNKKSDRIALAPVPESDWENKENFRINKKSNTNEAGPSSKNQRTNLKTLTLNENFEGLPKIDVSPIIPNPFSKYSIKKTSSDARIAKLIKRQRPARLTDYLDQPFQDIWRDHFQTSLDREQEVLPGDFLTRFGVSNMDRAKCINILLKIQVFYHLHEEIVYCSVNMFDRILFSIEIPQSVYEIVAVTCLWLASKMSGQIMTPSNILMMCSETYISKQMIHMERKILKILDFRIPHIEPVFFVEYFFLELHITPCSKLYASTYFILDFSTFFEEFSNFFPSEIAAGSILIAVKLFHKDEQQEVLNYLKKTIPRGTLARSHQFQLKLLQFMFTVDENVVSKVLLAKYKNCVWLLPVERSTENIPMVNL
ncbi:uncharacterized protein LOC114334481 [Diabrotica virgifera virgifera]|uniref:S-phase entry cyclin-6-like n=1 Tax=Diabrotica virgifera virgifera TaxID=50390 RepID=A0A6P7FVF6_DIAVI|nr:uncharacterized protein LOC114334481 [Diabrotica virgifera virgifera]